jgi:hypothetical protein
LRGLDDDRDTNLVALRSVRGDRTVTMFDRSDETPDKKNHAIVDAVCHPVTVRIMQYFA